MKRSTRIPTRCLLATLALLAACTPRPEPRLVVPLSGEAALSSPDGVPLATRLTFHGRSAWFAFDTGAGAHTLAGWFVDSAGMRVTGLGDLEARDAGGNAVSIRAVRDQEATLPSGGTLDLEAAIVADFPPAFESAELGGLLNPQLLAAEGEAVVLDLPRGELRIERYEDAIARLGARPVPADELRACRSDAAPIPNLVYAVRVGSAAGEAWLTLDTGADETAIRRGSPLVEGVALQPGGRSMGVAGRASSFEVAPGLPLRVGEQDVTVDAQVAPGDPQGCGPDGLLGLDALGGCALVLGRDALALACDR
jgi:hypothetical protein